jgi:hypothetical protein
MSTYRYESKRRSIWVQNWPEQKLKILSVKEENVLKNDWVMAQVVDCLNSKYKTLNPIPSTA